MECAREGGGVRAGVRWSARGGVVSARGSAVECARWGSQGTRVPGNIVKRAAFHAKAPENIPGVEKRVVFQAQAQESNAFYDVFWRLGAESHAFYDVFSRPAVTKLGFIARNLSRNAKYRVFVLILATWTRRNPRFNAMNPRKPRVLR